METKITPKREHLFYLNFISSHIPTFHLHYHFLADLADTYGDFPICYVEIGAYAGASASFMLKRNNTKVVSIDSAQVFTKKQVLENVIKAKWGANSTYTYIEGYSNDTSVITYAELEVPNGIDILFIDGDHSKKGVWDDFVNYFDMVRAGGFIVFDDYNDPQHSPEVKLAVDEIVATNKDKIEVIGCLPNTLGAHPATLKESNCFIIRKL